LKDGGGKRERLVPEKVRVQERMKEEERRRLDALAEKVVNGHTQTSQIPPEIRLGAQSRLAQAIKSLYLCIY
jgi:hypothetical protein